MRVEKIELIGFKSFGDRTRFNLHPGITCIVGPNGCGKSNVVDAFKWVLGEQSAKSLRGGKMEEVIFAGSQSKKPKGMSEVTLTVSGLAGGNGKDSLTSVTRRLYRSGESDYLLNRTSCRLRDIRDIFLDTGLEVKSYSILEQDRIAAILSAKPDERRFIIEEVAGVVKYKVRRHEAQNKLEHSRNNLQRINDIVAEVKRQINSLDRQVKKAERYKKFMEELRTIELKIAKRDFTSLNQGLQEILRLYGGTKEEDSLLRGELAGLEADLETKRIGLVEKEKALEAVQAELQGVEREMAEEERSIAVSKKEREHLKEHVIRLSRQGEENTEKRASAEARRQEIGGLRASLLEEIQALTEEMGRKADSLKEVKEEIVEKETLIDVRRRDSFRVSEEIGTLRNEQHRLNSSLENLRKREEGVSRESANLQEHMAEVEAVRKEIESSMLGKNNELLVIREEREALTQVIAGLRERLETLRTEMSRAREDLASASSRLESLNEMVFAESSGEDLKNDIHILASIADVIEVPREYERAVESALKEAVNGFILPTRDEVKRGVDTLKTKEMGRTAFIPEGIAELPPSGSLPDGALARAMDVLKAGEQFSAVVRNLLSNVAVVRDLETALSLGETPMTLVTLEGEIIEPTGVVIAGKSRGILTLKRQIRELEAEIEGRRSRLENMENETSGVQASLSEKESALSSLNERAVEMEKELSLLRLKAEKNSEEGERAGRKLSLLKIELEEIQKEQDTLKSLLAEKEAEIERQGERKAQVEQALQALQEEISGKKTLYEQRSAESVELKLSLNSRKERSSSLESEEESITRLLAELDEKEELIKNEIASTSARVEKSEAGAAEKEETLKGLAIRAGEISEKISQRKEVISSESEELISSERGLKVLRQKIDDFSHRLSELDVQRAEHNLRIENLKTNIKNTYDLNLEAVEAEDVTPEDEERLPELKKKLESLGPVSLGSIEEYEELKERYEFLTQQQEDLLKSIAELEEAISRINTTTRKRLRDAYDALKVKFAEVFVALFGGGRAELVLTDERNILETGIDIVAQPPGKKFQNISLLSGGEKTLTALALLFASFLIKPTPLCVLDEADAALDESNTVKFAEMLKDLSKEIQFIVITHNRVTMESANYIYGITMEEPGNSKAISLEMAEA